MQHLTLHPSRFLDRKELGSEREAGVEGLFVSSPHTGKPSTLYWILAMKGVKNLE